MTEPKNVIDMQRDVWRTSRGPESVPVVVLAEEVFFAEDDRVSIGDDGIDRIEIHMDHGSVFALVTRNGEIFMDFGVKRAKLIPLEKPN